MFSKPQERLEPANEATAFAKEVAASILSTFSGNEQNEIMYMVFKMVNEDRVCRAKEMQEKVHEIEGFIKDSLDLMTKISV